MTRRARAPLLDSVYKFTKRHEGVSKATNSHWGDADAVFQSNDMVRISESYVSYIVPIAGAEPYPTRKQAWLDTYFGALRGGFGPLAVAAKKRDSSTDPNGDYLAIARICGWKP